MDFAYPSIQPQRTPKRGSFFFFFAPPLTCPLAPGRSAPVVSDLAQKPRAEKTARAVMGAGNKPLLLSLRPRLWRHGSRVPLPIHLSMDHDSRSPVSVSFRLINHTIPSNRRLRSTDPCPSSSHPGPCVSHQSPANWLPGPRGRAAQGPKLPSPPLHSWIQWIATCIVGQS